MQTFELRLHNEPFQSVKSGTKTIEMRLLDEKRKLFNVGDKITFYKEPERTETMNAIILDKYLFNSS